MGRGGWGGGRKGDWRGSARGDAASGMKSEDETS